MAHPSGRHATDRSRLSLTIALGTGRHLSARDDTATRCTSSLTVFPTCRSLRGTAPRERPGEPDALDPPLWRSWTSSSCKSTRHREPTLTVVFDRSSTETSAQRAGLTTRDARLRAGTSDLVPLHDLRAGLARLSWTRPLTHSFTYSRSLLTLTNALTVHSLLIYLPHRAGLTRRVGLDYDQESPRAGLTPEQDSLPSRTHPRAGLAPATRSRLFSRHGCIRAGLTTPAAARIKFLDGPLRAGL